MSTVHRKKYKEKINGICMNDKCNLVCEQVHLQQFVRPSIVNNIGKLTIWTFKATNVSGRDINRKLVISSSLFGPFLLTNRFKSGETITINKEYQVTVTDVGNISNISFVAHDISTSLNHYKIGTRISPISEKEIIVDIVNDASLLISGTICSSSPGDQINVISNILLQNNGNVPISNFTVDLSSVFNNCTIGPGLSSFPKLIFQFVQDPVRVQLISGNTINPGENYVIEMGGKCSCTNTSTCCNINECIVDYSYSTAFSNFQGKLPLKIVMC